MKKIGCLQYPFQGILKQNGLPSFYFFVHTYKIKNKIKQIKKHKKKYFFGGNHSRPISRHFESKIIQTPLIFLCIQRPIIFCAPTNSNTITNMKKKLFVLCLQGHFQGSLKQNELPIIIFL